MRSISITYLIPMYSTGCSGKLCSFKIHCNPFLAYIAVRDLQSSQRNASVQSLLLAGNFLYNQQQPSAGEGEVAIFNEHPVLHPSLRRLTHTHFWSITITTACPVSDTFSGYTLFLLKFLSLQISLSFLSHVHPFFTIGLLSSPAPWGSYFCLELQCYWINPYEL